MLILWFILGAALAAVLGWVFLLKRDIRKLGKKLADITRTDTNAQLTTGTNDRDIAALAVSVNAALERNRRDLYEKNCAEADLKRAITNISHDLRTPLTSALGYLQMMDSPELDVETRTRYLETVRGRLDALIGLMERLFEFTKVIEGGTPMECERLNIAGILRESLAAVYSELCGKGFTVEADIPETPVYAMADKDALARVLQNVLRNVAVHGREHMRVSLRGGLIEIANKSDNLNALDIRQLFDRFYTVDAARTGQNTGLGLAIAKELLVRMNGQISAYVEGNMLVMKMKLPGLG